MTHKILRLFAVCFILPQFIAACGSCGRIMYMKDFDSAKGAAIAKYWADTDERIYEDICSGLAQLGLISPDGLGLEVEPMIIVAIYTCMYPDDPNAWIAFEKACEFLDGDKAWVKDVYNRLYKRCPRCNRVFAKEAMKRPWLRYALEPIGFT